MSEVHVVTGAFGYSGQRIARRLLDAGHVVWTLTNNPGVGHPLRERVTVLPLQFDDVDALAASLKGARVLYNTYWVRFAHRSFADDHAAAVRNTEALFRAAAKAGVARIVHVSITNPSLDSPLSYFAGKARLEQALRTSGLSHAILRPAVLFGGCDVLINNIAWMLRRFPIFGVFGDGAYRLQPIHVDDFAALAVAQGAHDQGDTIINAIGPETFTYRELIEVLGRTLGKRRPIISVPPRVGYWAASMMGMLVNDVILTWEEIEGLMADLLYVDGPAAGETRLTDWAREHAGELGVRYANELARRQKRNQ